MTPLKILIKSIARTLLWLEPLILATITYAFWLPTPERLILLWIFVPLGIARWSCHGRILTRTPLDLIFATFLILGVINIFFAPYTRGLIILARPLLGIMTYYAMVERARNHDFRGPSQVLIMLSLLLGFQALGSSQWTEKSDALSIFTDSLPTIQGAATSGGFNVNEIAGAMIWLLPLVTGIVIYRWQTRGIRWDVTLAFLTLLIALLLGQSRSAIAGLIIAFFFIGLFLLRGKSRIIAWIFVIAIAGLEIYLHAGTIVNGSTLIPGSDIGNNLTTEENFALESVSEPDELTLITRIEIWNSALSIIHDNPIFGIGLSMFRDNRVRSQYPIPSFGIEDVPHTHNEFLQITTDMGIPGLIVYLGIYGVSAYMLICAWRTGDNEVRTLSVAVGAGLLGHATFGITDAITLWDRFAFIFWLVLGMVGAVYARSIHSKPEN